jgi:hypothetical protein
MDGGTIMLKPIASLKLPLSSALPPARAPEIVIQVQLPASIAPGADAGCLAQADVDALVAAIESAVRADLPATLSLSVASACVASNTLAGVARRATTIGMWLPGLPESVDAGAALAAVALLADVPLTDSSAPLRIRFSLTGMRTLLSASVGTAAVGGFKPTGTKLELFVGAQRIDTTVLVRRVRNNGELGPIEYDLVWRETTSASRLDRCPPTSPIKVKSERRLNRVLNACAPRVPPVGLLGALLSAEILPVRIPLARSVDFGFSSALFRYANMEVRSDHLLFAAEASLVERKPCAIIRTQDSTAPPSQEGDDAIVFELVPPAPDQLPLQLQALAFDIRNPSFSWTLTGDLQATRSGANLNIDLPTNFPNGHGEKRINVQLTVRDEDQDEADFPHAPVQVTRLVIVRLLRL